MILIYVLFRLFGLCMPTCAMKLRNKLFYGKVLIEKFSAYIMEDEKTERPVEIVSKTNLYYSVG